MSFEPFNLKSIPPTPVWYQFFISGQYKAQECAYALLEGDIPKAIKLAKEMDSLLKTSEIESKSHSEIFNRGL